jgi:eukaryotic-like serine/threonine-protein kinase
VALPGNTDQAQTSGMSEHWACAGCGHDNTSGVHFCHGCGDPLSKGPDARPGSLFADGRYRVVRFLGEGAIKKVFLVEDCLLQREVAFSFLKSDGWGFWKSYPIGETRMTKEARLMAGLGEHPHILPVYDLGHEQGQPYLVTPAMAGDLESLVLEHTDRRLAPAEALAIADEILDALVHAHERGVVHRDIKPSNIFISPEGRARLGDFGLAMGFDPTALNLEGAIVGTVAYMAPEQALGEVCDGRSDLYAVGAVLYFTLTGRPPFEGDDSMTIISQHLEAEPVSPSWLNPAVTPSIDRFVHRLLAKRREDRPPDARAAREELAQLRAQQERRHSRSLAGEQEANPLDRLASRVFVGRQDELEALRGVVDEMICGRGRVVLIGGEPGVGKTRLVEETATYARVLGARVLWGRCNEAEGQAPYWPWLEALGRYVRRAEPETLLRQLGDGAPFVAELLPELRPIVPQTEQPPASEGERARFRLFGHLAAFLERVAEERALLIVIDDLHLADASSLLLLEFLASRLVDRRIAILSTYRGGQRPPHLPLTLSRLLREPATLSLTLSPLPRHQVHQLFALITGMQPQRRLIEWLWAETEGNPFFITELLRLLVERGDDLSRFVADPDLATLQGIDEVIEARLAALSPDCRRLLALAAVVGRDFGLSLLVPLAGRAPAEVARLLDEGLDARVLRRGDSARPYRFAHGLVRDVLYAGFAESEVMHLHGAVAQQLEVTLGRQRADRSSELAFHFSRSAPLGHGKKAAEYGLEAARHAAARFAWEEAAMLCDNALDSLLYVSAADPDRADLELDLTEESADALALLARMQEAAVRYRRALEWADEGLRRARLHRKLGNALSAERRLDEAVRAFVEAERDLGLPERREGASAVEACERTRQLEYIQLLLDRTWTHYYAGQLDELERLTALATPLVDRHATAVQRAHFYTCLVTAAYRRERYRIDEQTLGYVRCQAAALRALGDPEDACFAESMLGFAYLWRGDLEQAEDHLSTALHLSEEIGDPRHGLNNLTCLTVLHRLRGDHEGVDRFLQRISETLEGRVAPEFRAAASANEAWSLQRDGSTAAAESRAREAIAVWEESGAFPFEWLARWPLLAVLVGRGDWEGTIAEVEAMIRPGQHALPPALQEPLASALLEWQAGNQGAARRQVAAAADAARQLGYL